VDQVWASRGRTSAISGTPPPTHPAECCLIDSANRRTSFLSSRLLCQTPDPTRQLLARSCSRMLTNVPYNANVAELGLCGPAMSRQLGLRTSKTAIDALGHVFSCLHGPTPSNRNQRILHVKVTWNGKGARLKLACLGVGVGEGRVCAVSFLRASVCRLGSIKSQTCRHHLTPFREAHRLAGILKRFV